MKHPKVVAKKTVCVLARTYVYSLSKMINTLTDASTGTDFPEKQETVIGLLKKISAESQNLLGLLET